VALEVVLTDEIPSIGIIRRVDFEDIDREPRDGDLTGEEGGTGLKDEEVA